MYSRLYLFNSKIAARGYALNSTKHLKLQAELSETLQHLREFTKKDHSLKTTREIIQKFGEEHLGDQFFINTRKQSSSGLFEKNIETEKLLYIDKARSLLDEIKRECATIPGIEPAPFTKK